MAYRVDLLWAGETREPYARLAESKYLELLSRHARVGLRLVRPPRGLANGVPGRYILEEDRRLAAALKADDHPVLLDPAGREYESVALSRWLGAIFLSSRRPVFIVCGPRGPGALIRAAARESLSLTRMTLAHDLARVVLLEQLYRALDLLRSGPYHK